MERSHTKQADEHSHTSHLFSQHSRHWEEFKYVYPVVSRRSRGLSVGINLNPDTICNFDCVYCQVDKAEHPQPQPVDLDQLQSELAALLDAVTSGRLWQHPRFADVTPELKRLNDIAFSGDGEPTAAKSFPQAVRIVARLKQSLGLDDTKIILITNATLLSRGPVESAIRVLDKNQGEVWAKLDAGTEPYYKRIDRSSVPFKTILENILMCGKRRPIVIQSMLAQLHDAPFPDDEFDAYTQRLAELIEQGCRIKAVQLYTVARQPLELYVTALPDERLSHMARKLSRTLEDVSVQWFGERG